MLISTKLGLLSGRFVVIFCTVVLISPKKKILNVNKPLSKDLSPSHLLESGARAKEFQRYCTRRVNKEKAVCLAAVLLSHQLSEEQLIKR